MTPKLGESVTSNLGRFFVSTGVATAVAYVLIRVACDIFYGPLGLAPEDVGIGTTGLLQRAAGIVVLALVFAAVLAMPVLEIQGLRDGGPAWPGWVIGGWAVLVVVVWIVSSDAGPLVFLAGLVASGAHRLWHRDLSRRLVIGLAIFAAVVTALSLGTVYGAAVWDRDLVLDGRGLEGFERTLLPWDATVAELYWTAATPPPRPLAGLRCGVYLGTANGTAVVVDPRRGGAEPTVLRIVAANITIRTHFDTAAGEPVCGASGLERRPTR